DHLALAVLALARALLDRRLDRRELGARTEALVEGGLLVLGLDRTRADQRLLVGELWRLGLAGLVTADLSRDTQHEHEGCADRRLHPGPRSSGRTVTQAGWVRERAANSSLGPSHSQDPGKVVL